MVLRNTAGRGIGCVQRGPARGARGSPRGADTLWESGSGREGGRVAAGKCRGARQSVTRKVPAEVGWPGDWMPSDWPISLEPGTAPGNDPIDRSGWQALARTSRFKTRDGTLCRLGRGSCWLSTATAIRARPSEGVNQRKITKSQNHPQQPAKFITTGRRIRFTPGK